MFYTDYRVLFSFTVLASFCLSMCVIMWLLPYTHKTKNFMRVGNVLLLFTLCPVPRTVPDIAYPKQVFLEGTKRRRVRMREVERKEESREGIRKERSREWGREKGRKGGVEVPMGQTGKIFDSQSLIGKLEGLNVALTWGLSAQSQKLNSKILSMG